MSILFIGGTNIDYIATSLKPLIRHSSNIGKLEISFGGVMRNVVENCARLGADCEFITIIGHDTLGIMAKEYLERLNVRVYTPRTDSHTSSYIAINDNNHDMDVGVNDMCITEELNPKFLETLNGVISKHDYVFLDSNIYPEAIDYLFKTYPNKRFIIEGISATKILRFKAYLDNIYMVKCNIFEARSLVDMPNGSAKEVAEKILKSGTKTVVVSQGKGNIYFGENNKVDYVEIKAYDDFKGNTTGCGDALFAGIADHISEGYSLKESIKFGVILSQLTLETNKANNSDVSKLSYKHKY